jgi:ferredoxin
VEVVRNKNIELFVCSEVVDVKGYVGNFTISIKKYPTYVDPSRCTGCGDCMEACVLKRGVPSEFEEGMANRKAIYLAFPQAIPLKAVIDPESCLLLNRGKCKKSCVEACKAEAINFEQKDEIFEKEVGSIIIATGYDPFDPHLLPHQPGRILLGKDLDLSAVDHDGTVLRLDIAFVDSVYGIIFEEVGERFRVRDIIDGDPFDGRISFRGPEDISPDSSETVDPYFNGHSYFSLLFAPGWNTGPRSF